MKSKSFATLSLFAITLFMNSISQAEIRNHGGICQVSIIKNGKIFDMSLGDFEYNIDTTNPAHSCERLAIKIAKEKQAEPENQGSAVSTSYNYRGYIKLNP